MALSAKTQLALAYALAGEGTAEAAELAALFANTNNMSGVLGGIVANPGGGQGAAVALAQGINRVITVATLGDSVKLPAGLAGMLVVLINVGANACDVFPFVGDAINALAANVALRVSPGAALPFWCGINGTWTTEQPVPSKLAKFTLNAGAGPLVASLGDLSGASDVVAQYSGVNGSTLTTRTATQMFADQGNVQPGDSYNLRIVNSAGGTLTLTAGAGVTVTGHAAILTNTFVDYVVTFTSATALVMQSVGAGTQP